MFNHSAAAIDFCEKLRELVEDQSKWSQSTFGTDSERGPIGALRHLEKEAKEAADEAVGLMPLAQGTAMQANEALLEELADCFLLLLDASRRSGVGIGDLINASARKMRKNKQREWPKPTSDEPVEHIR